MSTLYTDISPYCCAVLASRVEDGSLPPGDVVMADVRTLAPEHMRGYRHVHLFAGIGGMALGLAWAGWPLGLSVVTFGFPCQDISAAGKGEGLAGARSGLFYEGKRIVEHIKPDRFIAENVGALETRGLDVVAAEMESIDGGGYSVEALRVGAWAVGAPHERERWWIVGERRTESDGVCGWSRIKAASRGRNSGAFIAGTSQSRITVLDAGGDGLRAERVGQARAELDEPCAECAVLPDAPSDGRQARAGKFGDAACPGGRRGVSESAVPRQGWQQPATGPWRRERDEWLYDGPPVLVYAGGAGRQERNAPAEPASARCVAGRPDPTAQRGWPVPVLPGYVQHDWELPRLHQRGVGDAVHGVSGRLAGTLNRCGVMALGNAVVPQVVKAIAGGVIEMARGGGK